MSFRQRTDTKSRLQFQSSTRRYLIFSPQSDCVMSDGHGPAKPMSSIWGRVHLMVFLVDNFTHRVSTYTEKESYIPILWDGGLLTSIHQQRPSLALPAFHLRVYHIHVQLHLLQQSILYTSIIPCLRFLLHNHLGPTSKQYCDVVFCSRMGELT